MDWLSKPCPVLDHPLMCACCAAGVHVCVLLQEGGRPQARAGRRICRQQQKHCQALSRTRTLSRQLVTASQIGRTVLLSGRVMLLLTAACLKLPAPAVVGPGEGH